MNKHIRSQSGSDIINRIITEKHLTQADVVRKTGLSRSVINRICRNSNDKGEPYIPTDDVFWILVYDLRMSEEEKSELENAWFPEKKILRENVGRGLSSTEINEILYESECKLLGYKRSDDN